MTRRRLSIFGSTGSIGQSTVTLLRERGCENFEIVALSGARNVALLAEQALELRPYIAVTACEESLPELRERLRGSGIETAAGSAALAEAGARPADWVMSAIVGAAGLAPGLAAAAQGGTLALANKESLVCAGALLKRTCAENGARLLPVDSEHSAIFQSLGGASSSEIERLVLTASGGPFRDWPLERMAQATPEQAVRHPNWDMGARISVDSASMFNKALEVIEAHELFDASSSQIEVIVHPQSVIHSMVGFRDGALIAQLGPSDMIGPIGYALDYPSRAPLPVERLDFAALSRLDFQAPDPERFPALRLAYAALDAGGAAGLVLNAAKETALDAFLARQIGFLDMARVVEDVMTALHMEAADVPGSLDAVLGLDEIARAAARRRIATGDI